MTHATQKTRKFACALLATGAIASFHDDETHLFDTKRKLPSSLLVIGREIHVQSFRLTADEGKPRGLLHQIQFKGEKTESAFKKVLWTKKFECHTNGELQLIPKIPRTKTSLEGRDEQVESINCTKSTRRGNRNWNRLDHATVLSLTLNPSYSEIARIVMLSTMLFSCYFRNFRGATRTTSRQLWLHLADINSFKFKYCITRRFQSRCLNAFKWGWWIRMRHALIFLIFLNHLKRALICAPFWCWWTENSNDLSSLCIRSAVIASRYWVMLYASRQLITEAGE